MNSRLSFFKKEDLTTPALWYVLMLASVSLLDKGEIKVIRLVDIFALITFILLIKEKWRKRELAILIVPWWKTLVGFGLIAVLAFAYSFSLPFDLNIPNAVGAKAPYVRGFIQTGKLFFAVIMFYWLTINVVNNYQELRIAIWFFTAGAALATLYGLFIDVGFMLGYSTGQMFTEEVWVVPRLYATGKEPLFFANYLVFAIPLTFFLITIEAQKYRSRLLWVMLTLEIFALILTFSAGGWIGLIVVIVSLLLLRFKTLWDHRKGLLITGIAVILGLILLINIYPILSRGFIALTPKITSIFRLEKLFANDLLNYSPSVTSTTDRKNLSRTAINIFKDHPVIGVGLGNYAFVFNQYKPPDVQRYNFVSIANNQYLEILAETGILGFIFYISFILMICWKSLQAILARPPSLLKNALTFIFCGLLGVLVQYLTFSSTPLNYFWISAGLLMAVINIADKEDRVCHEDRD